MKSQMWAAQLAVAGGHHHGTRLIILTLILAIVVVGAVILVRRAKRPRHLVDDWKPPTTPHDGPLGGTS